jgi:chromosome segregation ATPase
MTYLVSQIWLCLLITAFISAILGWLLRGNGKNKRHALNTQWQDKYNTLNQERTDYVSKIHKLTGVTHEKERLEHKITSQQQIFDQQIERLKKKITSAENNTQQHQALLTQKDEELAISKVQLDKKTSEFEDKKQDLNSDIEEKLRLSEKKLGEEKQRNNQLVKDIEKSEWSSSQQESKEKQQRTDYQEKANTLITTQKNLDNERSQVTNLTKQLAIKEKQFNEQLNQQDIRIATTLADKEKIENNLNDVKTAYTALQQDFTKKETPFKKQLADNITHKNTAKTEENHLLSEPMVLDADKVKNDLHPTTDDLSPEINQAKKETSHTPDTKEQSTISGIKDMFASAGLAGLAKSGIEKAKDSLHQAKESLTQYPDTDEAIFPIDAIQSISNEDDNRLYTMGIKTTADLLAKTATDKGVQLLSKSLGKEEWVIRTWVNNADLIRVKGVDGILAELLELSGTNTIAELANASTDKLSEEIATVHQHITKRSTLPTLDEINLLISEAKKLV